MVQSCLPKAAPSICAAKKRLRERCPNVGPIVWGHPRRKETWQNETALCVYVDRKIPEDALDETVRIPKEVDGIPTAVASLPGIRSQNILFGNMLSGFPIVCRTTALTLKEEVFFYSTVRKDIIKGVVEQFSFDDPRDRVPLRVSHHGVHKFANYISVRNIVDHDHFSRPGDSGALVFDNERRAVGTIIGGSQNRMLSYVLALRTDEGGALDRATFETFFRLEGNQ